jgi:antitoxin VapB
MPLHIKNSEANRLAQELANLTGESKTTAVIESLRERLQRTEQIRDRSALAADLRAIGRKCASQTTSAKIDHAGLLYDERGLPR